MSHAALSLSKIQPFQELIVVCFFVFSSSQNVASMASMTRSCCSNMTRPPTTSCSWSKVRATFRREIWWRWCSRVSMTSVLLSSGSVRSPSSSLNSQISQRRVRVRRIQEVQSTEPWGHVSNSHCAMPTGIMLSSAEWWLELVGLDSDSDCFIWSQHRQFS